MSLFPNPLRVNRPTGVRVGSFYPASSLSILVGPDGDAANGKCVLRLHAALEGRFQTLRRSDFVNALVPRHQSTLEGRLVGKLSLGKLIPLEISVVPLHITRLPQAQALRKT